MKLRSLVIILTIMSLGVSSAFAQTQDGVIGIFTDMAGTQCDGTFASGGFGSIFVIGKLAGMTAAGVKAAEFRINGFPAAWTVFQTANPAANAIVGIPFSTNAEGGVNMAFGECQSAGGEDILLYTMGFLAGADTDLVLTITSKLPPGNPSKPWVSLFLCDDPTFTQVQVGAGQYFMNGGSGECVVVGIEAQTWSGVKSLYNQ